MHNYKLYRNLKDIIVPSISRKNISNYKVVIDNDILPIEVYYPNKNIKLENIIIYIPRDNKTTNLYNDLAINTNNLVIVLDYDSNKKNYYNTIKYIYNNTDIYIILSDIGSSWEVTQYKTDSDYYIDFSLKNQKS